MYNKKVLIDSLKKLGSAKAPTQKKDIIVGSNNPAQMLSMKKGGSSVDKKLSVKKSNIQGKGLFIDQPIRKGEIIGLAHLNNQATPVVGKYHNHSEDSPTAVNISKGNKRYLVAARDLPAGTEITTNYRLQPELEQPEDFMQKGGMTPQKDGYRTYSPFKNLPFIDVETDTIDTDNIVYDLQLRANNGVTKNVQKNTGLHKIPGATVIREIPMGRKGGSAPKLPKKKNSKGYSRSLEATNRLFAEHPFFAQSKSRKNKIYDPNSKYFQFGGMFTEKGANVYFNPTYMNNFTGGTNSYEKNMLGSYRTGFSPVVGIEGSLSKSRRADEEKGRGWLYNAYAGLNPNAMKEGNYTPSAGLSFDFENSPQDRVFRPFAQIGADYNPDTGLNAGATTGARFPFTPYGNKRIKPGYAIGHLDIYGGIRGGYGKMKADGAGPSGGLAYGARVHGKYMPERKSVLGKLMGKGAYFYGDAGIQFDPQKGQLSQKMKDYTIPSGAVDYYGNAATASGSDQDSGLKFGNTIYANVGVKKELDDIKFKKDDRARKIQEIEDNEKRAFQENEIKQVIEKPKKECPEGEERHCADCPCEPIERVSHPRWLQEGGEYIETELTPEEIEQYAKGGYIIEDISIPSLPKAQLGKIIKSTKNIVFPPTPDQKFLTNYISNNFGPHVTSQHSADIARRLAREQYQRAVLDAQQAALFNASNIDISTLPQQRVADLQNLVTPAIQSKINKVNLHEAEDLLKTLDPSELDKYIDYRPFRIYTPSGSLALHQNTDNLKDNLFSFNVFMNKPREAGLAFNYANKFFPYKNPSILEKNSLSLDSFNMLANMGRRPEWDIQFDDMIDMNALARHSKLFEGLPSVGRIGAGHFDKATGEEMLRRLNAMIAEKGFSEKADWQYTPISGDNLGIHKFMLPNYKITRKYSEGGDFEYELGDEVDETTMQELEKLGYTFEQI
jgi:hypothetical protein